MKTPMLAATGDALAVGKFVVRACVKKMDKYATRQRLKKDYDRLSRMNNRELAALGLSEEEIRGVRLALYADYASLSWG